MSFAMNLQLDKLSAYIYMPHPLIAPPIGINVASFNYIHHTYVTQA